MNTTSWTVEDVPELEGKEHPVFFEYKDACDYNDTIDEPGYVYTWQTVEEGGNKLRYGYIPIDVYAFIVLPDYFGEEIELPDDENWEEDEPDFCSFNVEDEITST